MSKKEKKRNEERMFEIGRTK